LLIALEANVAQEEQGIKHRAYPQPRAKEFRRPALCES